MSLFFVAFSSLFAYFVLFCVWILICNNATHRQRGKIIDLVYNGPNWRQSSNLLNKVSYDQHLYELVMLRDWRKIYPKELRILETFDRNI